MAISNLTKRLEEQSARYFDRPGFSSPAFIDANHIALLDDRNGVPQISILELASGAITPATTFGERVLTLLASSISGTIVFGMDEGGNEQQQIWAIAPGASPTRLTTSDTSRHEPVSLSRDGNYVYFRSNARSVGEFDIERIDLVSGERGILLENAGQPMDFVPNSSGTKLFVESTIGNLASILFELDTADGTIRNLAPGPEGATIFSIAAAGDDALWVSTNQGRDFGALIKLNLATLEATEVFAKDWDVEAVSPSPDGKWLAVSVNEDGASKLLLLGADDGGRIDIDAPWGTFDNFSWSPASDKVAFGFSTADAPSCIFVSDLTGATTEVAKTEEATTPATVVPELIHFESFDGRSIPAFLFLPPGEGPHPIIVDIHGGPEGQRRLNYQPIDQYLVSLGFGVLATNVRGSTGYGNEYTHLDDIELRLDSVKDISYAVAWLKERDDIANDKIIVMGQSYGGFMTLASLCFYPDLWAAGFDIVGIANFVSFLERTGAWRRKHREHEYGSLENNRAFLEHASPLTHVNDIVAPLFIVHGRNDPRVPLFEAEQIEEALRQRGRTVELRVFDDEGHGLSKRKNKVVGYAAAAKFLLNQIGIEPTSIG